MKCQRFPQIFFAAFAVALFPFAAVAQPAQNTAENTTQEAPTSDPKAQALAKLSPEQRQKLEAAAAQGEEAFLAAVQELVAGMSPEAAASLVQGAIALAGNSSLLKQAGLAGATVEQWLVQESETVKQGQPLAILKLNGETFEYRAQADGVMIQLGVPAGGTIDTAALAAIRVSGGFVAAAIANAAAAANPAAAPAIAAAATAMAPSAATSIAAAVSATVPSAAPAIAQSVAQIAPQQADAISQAVTNSVPTADPAAIQAAAQTGAQQSTNNPGFTGSANNTGGVQLPSGGSGGGSGSGGGPPASR